MAQWGCQSISGQRDDLGPSITQGSVWVVALALSLALALPGVIAAAIAATATAAAATLEGNVGCLGLATAGILLDVESHLSANDHIFGTAIGQLREVHKNVTRTIRVLDEAKALSIHELLQGSCVCHRSGRGAMTLPAAGLESKMLIPTASVAAPAKCFYTHTHTHMEPGMEGPEVEA